MFLLQHFINIFKKTEVFISFLFSFCLGENIKQLNFKFILQNCLSFCTLMGGIGGGDISGNQSQRLSKGGYPQWDSVNELNSTFFLVEKIK